MKKIITILNLLLLNGVILASNFSVDFSAGSYLGDPDISINKSVQKNNFESDSATLFNIVLNYKFNDFFSVYAGFADNGMSNSGFIDLESNRVIYAELEGFSVFLGAKAYPIENFYLKASVGATSYTGTAEYGSTGARIAEKDIDDSGTMADIGVGYQFFPASRFSVGIAAGYRYFSETSYELYDDLTLTVDPSAPYAAIEAKIKF